MVIHNIGHQLIVRNEKAREMVKTEQVDVDTLIELVKRLD